MEALAATFGAGVTALISYEMYKALPDTNPMKQKIQRLLGS
jgi:hypothetical protein